MTEAEILVEEGNKLADAGDADAAERAYRAAMAISPEWSVPYYDLGLLCKYAGRWQECLEFSLQASARDPDDEAAWWNTGIAATALGSWSEARRAWSACAMTPPPGEGPPDFAFGSIPVRLTGDPAEVVWAHRIDPARARILNVPLPTSAHHYDEVVLTDGASDGFRRVDGKEYPVLNVLAILEASSFRKYVIELATADEAAVNELIHQAELRGGAAENWGTSTNILCAKCSRGEPHEHGGYLGAPAHPHFGLAARDDEQAQAIIDAWLESTPRADLVRWFESSVPAA